MSPGWWRVAAGYSAAATVITFALYAWDKRAALRGGRRLPERMLQTWTWAGGCVGALGG
jgi:uncharacterized membrane protein YsdA (DUF1294 family)